MPTTGVYYLNVIDYWGTTGSNTQYTLKVNAVPPVAPTNLTALAASMGQINLRWTDASTDETAQDRTQDWCGPANGVKSAPLPQMPSIMPAPD